MATLLGRYYYNSNGNNKWMATLTQSGGSPLPAVLPLLTPADLVSEPRPAAAKMVPIYLGLGTLAAGGGGTWQGERQRWWWWGGGGRSRWLNGIWRGGSMGYGN
ncbi:hypothetical protein ZWY2020_023415 [Hordeum vulgare]|nr:hypothetical protein ZWY2020_023415 [Hordeum vulgare]